jgi:hypothetical protein
MDAGASTSYRPEMAARRKRFDPLELSDKPRWLSRLDEHNRVQEVFELPPGTDLRAALARRLDELKVAGWTIEGIAFSGTFIRTADSRHYVAIYPSDPRDQPISLHGAYPGSHR